MAEAFFRDLAGDDFAACSAGTETAIVSPLAKEVMFELGIDISAQKPNGVTAIFRQPFHYVVALCDAPRERYPLYPFARMVLRWSVADPDAATGGPIEQKQVFRQVRDELRERVGEFVQTLRSEYGVPEFTHAAAA
jgi:arsenate reductase